MQANLKQLLGQQAEQKACTYLLAQGLTLLEKNYRSPFGEIDLILQDGEIIVFTEVRSRKNTLYGSAIESINKPKQQKVIKSAIYYLKQQRCLGKYDFRFDVIGICHDQLEWIKHAFTGDNF